MFKINTHTSTFKKEKYNRVRRQKIMKRQWTTLNKLFQPLQKQKLCLLRAIHRAKKIYTEELELLTCKSTLTRNLCKVEKFSSSKVLTLCACIKKRALCKLYMYIYICISTVPNQTHIWTLSMGLFYYYYTCIHYTQTHRLYT